MKTHLFSENYPRQLLKYAFKKGHISTNGFKKGQVSFNKTHGMSKTNFYRRWKAIRSRCNNHNTWDYKYYGGRGIKVCKEWDLFENFYKDMFPSYKEGLTIDRIDNNRGYYRENCRWVTKKQQCYNRRSNIYLTFNGLKKTIMEWSLDNSISIKYSTLYARFRKGLDPFTK